VAKVLRKLKDKKTKSKNQRHNDKPHSSGPLSPASPDSVGPHENAEGCSALNVDDVDQLVGFEGQDGEDISIEVVVGERDDADEDPWEPDRHTQPPDYVKAQLG
jgi:hypothetical protein